jgi:hypothetical protein
VRWRGKEESGTVVWLLWLVVIALVAVTARYAFIAAQPDRTGYTLFGRDGSLIPADQPSRFEASGDDTNRAPRQPTRAYSAKDRAKLDELVNKAPPAKRQAEADGSTKTPTQTLRPARDRIFIQLGHFSTVVMLRSADSSPKFEQLPQIRIASDVMGWTAPAPA